MPADKTRYGIDWPSDWSDLQIEFYCIERGGQWLEEGTVVGEGLFEHYRKAQRLLWPTDDEHRWTDLILRSVVENDVNVIMGASDSGKSWNISKFILTDYWARPEKTLWLISSTELRGAELRIWGAIKNLFNVAKNIHPWLAGNVLESKHAISTESITEDRSKARLLTKGLIFIPCLSGGKYVGLGRFVGMKPMPGGRLGHVGDECQAMAPSFLDAYSNWIKPNFKGILTGNPFDYEDPLCRAAEPVEGWNGWKDTEKTQQWRSKFYDAHVIALDGRDSPNLDYEGLRFPYLIGRRKLGAVERTHGKDSWQWYNQCVGKPRPGAMLRRVITRQLCEEKGAFDEVIWADGKLIKVAACDAAYGGVGGDDCIAGHIEFGVDVNGNSILACYSPVLVPVSVSKKGLPEEQIAKFMKEYCDSYEIPYSNFFFDARATMAITFARIMSTQVNVVDFGGPPTERPVSLDTFIWDGDTQQRRLQQCKELYSKFVTELWYTIHYIVLSSQMRRLPKEVAEEGYKREWKYVKGNRIEVETKADMKLRTGHSPDRFDWLVTAVEGARRLGFEIKRLAKDSSETEDDNWLEKEIEKHKKFLSKTTGLKYA